MIQADKEEDYRVIWSYAKHSSNLPLVPGDTHRSVEYGYLV